MICLKSSKFINEFSSIFLEIKSHMSDHQSAYNSGNIMLDRCCKTSDLESINLGKSMAFPNPLR